MKRLQPAPKKIILLLRQKVNIPLGLAMRDAFDLTDTSTVDAEIGRLLDELKLPPPQPKRAPECPYPGMRAFDESRASQFFGRDAETKELKRRLKRHPFLTVVGPSGCGKSSLVFAGLAPELRGRGLSGSETWRIYSLRPGGDPMSARSTLLPAKGRPRPGPSLGDLLTPPRDGLKLIVIDQFEELFTIAGADETKADDVMRFQQLLLQGAETERCFVVITARADFYDELMVSPLWPQIKAHRMELPPLGAEQLREAIVRPAEDSGVYIDASLVTQLLSEAQNQPGALPLVQETLVLLWKHLDQRFLPQSAYQEMVRDGQSSGEADGLHRTGLQMAVARHATKVFQDLSEEQQTLARRIFLRLVQPVDGRLNTRRQQLESELQADGDAPGALDKVIEKLVRERLLTVSSTDGDSGSR